MTDRKNIFFDDEEELGLVYDDGQASFDSLEEKAKERVRGSCCSVEDSLAYCINDIGKVDVRYMAMAAEVSEDDILAFHAGRTIYQNPEGYVAHRDEYDDWMLEVEYLRGNLHELLRVAVTYNDMFDGRFSSNIALIRRKMPDPPSFYDIHTRLGASWIYEDVVADFIMWLMKLPYRPTVKHAEGKWKIKNIFPVMDVTNRYTYGTGRMSAMKIIEHTLNASSVKVYDEVADPESKSGVRRVVNQGETLNALGKQQLILDMFQKWLGSKPKVMQKLMDAYSEVYSHAVPHYDGSFLSLPDVNPDIRLYRHQKDAAMRIILSDSTVLCHDVGSGKTFCYILGIHELYRMGISTRNMVVVPNATFAGTVAQHRTLYPNDKLLEISPSSFKAGERQKIIDEIKNGDYVAIYIAYSKFDMLTLSRDYAIHKIQDEIGEAQAGLTASDPWVRDTYRAKIERLKKAKEKLMDDYFPDERGCFDELGITTLVVDECQNYKNISVDTRLENVTGLSSSSKKANLMLDKVRTVQKSGGRIVFATGTLLTNSISDLYVFQTYLQPAAMKGCSISTFGEWANTFGSLSTNFEVDVNAQNYRYVSRISHYHNLPELMAVFNEVCDFYHISDGEMDLPDFKGFTDIVIEPTEFHKRFNAKIVKRTDAVRNGKVRLREDNILRIVTDGRKAALDIRLVDDEAVVSENDCKAGACAKQVAELYYRYPGTSQIIFCDYSTPKAGFNVYDEVKRYLIMKGIPEAEIAFIHDGTTEAKKNKLLRDLDDGKIRVMLGSTERLGIGVNVQRHLIALHHLDAPWRPSDLTQREGRLIRQGNQNSEVFEFRYMTANSFDAYVWQILENKQHFIGSFLAGSMSEFHRTESEIDTIMLDYSEVKALAVGNPLIRERIVTANSLERAKIAQRERYKQLYELREKLGRLPAAIREQEDRIAVVKNDLDFLNTQRAELEKLGKKVAMTREERADYGEKLLAALRKNIGWETSRVYGSYMRFGVYFPEDMTAEAPYIILRRGGGGSYRVDLKDKDAAGVTQSMDGVFAGFGRRLEKLNRVLDKLKNEQSEVMDELSKGNAYDEEVDELSARLGALDARLETA